MNTCPPAFAVTPPPTTELVDAAAGKANAVKAKMAALRII